MKAETYNQILEAHRKTFKYDSIPSKHKIVITFSGNTGSGKTTIAKKLEREYKGVRISNDEIRELIRSLLQVKNEVEVQKYLIEYLKKFRETLAQFPNKIIILDSTIDRRYEIVNKFYGPRGYIIFIIALDVERNVLVGRLRKRVENRKDLSDFLNKLDDRARDTRAFQKSRPPDFVAKEFSDKEYELLRNEIDKKLST